MKLHRLVLRNYRGIAYRDIEFPDHGVVVVSGANEIGKSSMIEALDLLLRAKDRSTKKEVKQVKPTHVDEGAEITAVISTGPYRFEYYKRFHKRPETRLTVTAPAREQLTGDEAHDRVQGILAETVDTELWQAQRVMQSASTASVDLSGCDALARALDVAAGQASTLSGTEPLLIDRIEGEFRQYFTATGRPSGQWAAAVSRLREAGSRSSSAGPRSRRSTTPSSGTRRSPDWPAARLTGPGRRATRGRQAAAAAVARLEERLARRVPSPNPPRWRGRVRRRPQRTSQTACRTRRAQRHDLGLDIGVRAAADELAATRPPPPPAARPRPPASRWRRARAASRPRADGGADRSPG